MSSESAFKRHKPELIAGVVGVALSVGSTFANFPTDVAWFIGILSATLAVSTAILKEHVSTEFNRIAKEFNSIAKKFTPVLHKTTDIVNIFSEIADIKLEFADKELDQFIRRLKNIRRGRVPLVEAQYYTRIIQRMRSSDRSTKIIATNSIDERRWSDDPRQLNYMDANKKALDRGASISRVFIINKVGLSNPAYKDALEEIAKQIQDERMDVKVVWLDDLPKEERLVEDWVLFDDSNPEVFHAFPDNVDTTRVDRADLVTEPSLIHQYRSKYEKLMTYAVSREVFFASIKGILNADSPSSIKSESDDDPSGNAPGLHLKAHHLEEPVVTCEEAAAAKNILLKQELKTILLDTDIGVVAVHVQGNHRVSLRKVKKLLQVEQARQAGRDTLDHLGLIPGTVCPVREPVWSLKSLLDARVLNNEFMSSNKGTLTTYIFFSPNCLLDAPDVTVGDFTSLSEE